MTAPEQLLDEIALSPQRLAQGVAEIISSIRLATLAGGSEPIGNGVQHLPSWIARQPALERPVDRSIAQRLGQLGGIPGQPERDYSLGDAGK